MLGLDVESERACEPVSIGLSSLIRRCCVDMKSLLMGSTSDVAAEISGKCGMTKATEIIGLRSCGAVNP